MSTADNLLVASYETMRASVLTSYLQNPGHFNSAYVYAWLHRMPAIGLADHENVFWRAARIDTAAVRYVKHDVDKFVANRQLERLAYDRLSTTRNIVNLQVQGWLMTILGYFSLKGDYSLEVKQALRVNLPPEKSLVTAFGPEMITFPS
ncbi:hypothetical protein [Rhizobium sp. BK176]|uniref:hypothetical protein n=1 Tax=Rhizobium sp. BK176 TaxID=2587071 RepID=UPI002167E726|nr:hypothetical protein [Rhizobium sp. BK176]MCS4088432.1 hypothetical protein [Rhizobium sp. BK176]